MSPIASFVNHCHYTHVAIVLTRQRRSSIEVRSISSPVWFTNGPVTLIKEKVTCQIGLFRKREWMLPCKYTNTFSAYFQIPWLFHLPVSFSFCILIKNRFQTTWYRRSWTSEDVSHHFCMFNNMMTFKRVLLLRMPSHFYRVFLQISFYSPPFYSSRHGYMMCCRLYPLGDGSGSGTHVSFFFAIMQGEHDSLLRWPFQQRVTLTLLDQSPARRHVSETFLPNTQSSSFQRPTSILNVASGCPRFVSHDQLTSTACKYINAGIVFLRVKVDLSGLQLLWIWNFFTSINSFILTKFRPQKNSFFFALVFFSQLMCK